MVNPKTDTFEEVKRLIYSTCIKFQRKYGGDVEELASEANVYFMEAYITYDLSKGPFSQWVRFRVSRCLLETVRNAARRNSRLGRVALDLTTVPVTAKNMTADVKALVEVLPIEEAEIVEMVLAAPTQGLKPETVRAELRRHLKERGWSKTRIKQAFDSIASALKRTDVLCGSF